LSAALAASRVPPEFIGRGRVLRDKIGDEDEPTGRLINSLATRLTDRIKDRRNPIPRPDVLRGVADAWRRNLPPRSRLDLSIELQKKSLRIHEVRLSSSVYRSAAWAEHERGVVIMAITLEAAPFHYRFATATIAHVSAHAIARRLQRGRGGSEAEVLHDLRMLAQAYAALSGRPDGEEFTVPAGDGAWVGTVKTMQDRAAKAAGKSMLVRTFLADRV
jgi:hypothetical protein